MNKLLIMGQRHWKPLLWLNGIVLSSALALAIFSPRTWTASSELILPNPTSNLDANLGTLGSLRGTSIEFSNIINPLNTQAAILTSLDVLVAARALDAEKSLYPRLTNYRKLFKVTPADQTTTLLVEVKGSDPDLARQRATTLLQVYQQRLNTLRQQAAVALEQFNRNKLEAARKNLLQAQSRLARFRSSSGLINPEEQTRGIVATINTLQAAQGQALAQAESNQTLAQILSARLGLTPEQAIKSLRLAENKDYQFLQLTLSQLDATLVQTRARFTDNAPAVQSLLFQRQQLQRRIQQDIAQAAANTLGVDTTVDISSGDGRAALIQRLILADSEARTQRRQAAQLQTEVDQLNAALRSSPAQQAQLLELQRQYDIAEGVYKGLIAQVQQASISAFNSYPNVQILSQPNVDPKHTSPKGSLIALGGILASVFGSLALVSFLESRNPLLQPKDLQQMGFPVLVLLPRVKQPLIGLNLAAETSVEFQRLASLISLMPLQNRRLMVTSSTFGEGKTTVTLGVALALVDLGFRVLVVDGDFRTCQLSQRLGYDPTTAYNFGLRPVNLRPGLDLMPTMPHEGTIIEFVANGSFEQAIQVIQATSDYDYVIVDTGPVGFTSETARMAVAVPNVLFVARPGLSGRNLVYDSLKQLQRHNAQIMGVVVNGLNPQTDGYSYGYTSTQEVLEV